MLQHVWTPKTEREGYVANTHLRKREKYRSGAVYAVRLSGQQPPFQFTYLVILPVIGKRRLISTGLK
jgi:hypothetical protein